MLHRGLRMISVGALVFLLIGVGSAGAADFPTRNITIIVTFSPGGGFDSIARAVGRSMKKYLPEDVNVIVKNVTGAGGIRGTVAAYRAKPNGYTIAHIQASGMLGLQMLRGAKRTGFDLNKYTWLARVGADPYGLLVASNGPYKSVADLQKAKRVTWGVEGIGVGRWFGSFLSAQAFNIDFHVVSGYRGTGESLPGLLRGDFDVWAQPIDHPSVTPYLKNDVRPIVQEGKKNPVNAPDVPTSEQLGYDFVYSELRAFGGPPGIPADRAKILEDLLLKAMNDPEYVAWKNKSKIVLVPAPGSSVLRDLKYFTSLFEKNKASMQKTIAQENK